MLNIDFQKLYNLIETSDVENLKSFILENDLEIRDGKIFHKNIKEVNASAFMFDQKQLVSKNSLNSAYGSFLNPGCRFYDKRIGQSCTLSGRVIVRHMASYINNCITGKYDHNGEAIIYGDTDSSIFSVWPLIQDDVKAKKTEWDKETCIKLYEELANQVNDSFPEACFNSFHAPEQNGKIIRCGMELVGRTGLFITKKRYAIMMYYKDGKHLDLNGSPGKMKAMGLDLKRADTPKIVQDFLRDILFDILNEVDFDLVKEKIVNFKEVFQNLPAWEKGMPKRVNNLTKFRALEAKKKANLPGHVRASLNWNVLRQLNNDNTSLEIFDGMKVVVCKLRNSPLGYTSVAYPVDEHRLPEWFKELPFDSDTMSTSAIDKKIENLIGILNLNIETSKQTRSNFSKFFK
jgi:hypothetical protein